MGYLKFVFKLHSDFSLSIAGEDLTFEITRDVQFSWEQEIRVKSAKKQ